MMGAPSMLPTDGPSEGRPLTDAEAQHAAWRTRLVSMVRRDKGSDAHRLAGRLLAEHGDGARHALQSMPRDGVWQRADAMLERCGLGVLL